MYQKLAGMTGTAKTEEDEFRDIYNMDVVVIPTNMPIAREDLQDSVYQTERGKFKAIANRVAEVHTTGQPVLVGTISIEKSELISEMLKKRGVKHNVLNAKQHDKEAEIVADAGRLGMVTIATNMAGRGTDIILGGNPEFEAKKEMQKLGYSDEAISFASSFVKSNDPELNEARAKFKEIHENLKAERKEEQQKVVELGGLCIIGTERHESRRIDNQLRGRSGRQGRPRSDAVLHFLEDELMRLFGGERMQKIVDRMGLEEDEAIEAGMLSKSIEGAQKKVEGKSFGIRKYVVQYDNVMNKQREIIYDERRKVLFGEDLRDYIINMAHSILNAIVDPIVVESKFPEEWDFETLSKNLQKISDKYRGKLQYTTEELNGMTEESLRQSVCDEFDEIYAEKEAEIGSEQMREVERMILLRVVDNLWMDHIDAMDQLKPVSAFSCAGSAGSAAAYAKEGFDMFEQMISAIQEDTVKYCYNVTVETKTERKAILEAGEAKKSEYIDDDMVRAMQGGGELPEEAQVPEREAKQQTVRRDHPKVGRNDLCPCGSGNKYKNCCGKNE